MAGQTTSAAVNFHTYLKCHGLESRLTFVVAQSKYYQAKLWVPVNCKYLTSAVADTVDPILKIEDLHGCV